MASYSPVLGEHHNRDMDHEGIGQAETMESGKGSLERAEQANMG